MKRALVVLVHPNEQSLSARAVETVIETLQKLGCEIRSHGLYKEPYNPILSRREFNGYSSNPDVLYVKYHRDADDLTWADTFGARFSNLGLRPSSNAQVAVGKIVVAKSRIYDS